MKLLLFLIVLILFLIVLILLRVFIIHKENEETKKNLYKYLENFVKDVDRYNSIYPRKVITIPVYYINMDKSTDRNEWMKKQLLNVERSYRVPAVNGYKIKNKKHDMVDGIEFYNQFELTLPEIGCTLSHLKAIQMAYENGEEMVIIMEDDIYIDMINLLDYRLETLVENAPKDWEIIKLVNNSTLIGSASVYKNHSYIMYDGKPAYSAGAYVINRKGMKTLLDVCGTNPYHLSNQKSGETDSFLWEVSNRVYILEPSVVTHINTELSSTIHDDHTVGHLYASKRIIEKYKNNFSRSISESNLKILNLIIYNENEEHERLMKKELEIYLEKFPNVIFYFIAYRNQNEDIMNENNCIYLKGKEGFIPQVLDKTIIALEYCCFVLKIKFDFFVRSNVSSILNFDNFPIFELSFDKCYSSCFMLKLEWLDPKFGINEKNFNKLKGTKFASGTNIIMSRDVVNYLLENKSQIDRTIIDDVSIGFTLQKFVKEIKRSFSENKIDKNVFVIRNKSLNRYDDVLRMKKMNKNVIRSEKCLIISANFGSIDTNNLISDMILYDDSCPFPKKDLSNRLRAKYFRMCSHQIHPSIPYFIWVDSSIVLKEGIIDWMMNQLGDYDAIFFKHSKRSSIEDEKDFVVKRINEKYIKVRYGDDNMEEQVQEYLNEGFPDNLLIESGLFLRRNTEKVNRAFENWFIEQLKWSLQDQLSLPYILWKHNINFKLITEYDVYNGPFHKHMGHKIED